MQPEDLQPKEDKRNWIVRFFEPRSNFYQLLIAQANTTLIGMEALEAWIRDGAASRCQSVRDHEHEADRQKLALMESLVDTLITPLDREDIYDLSTKLDEVINSAKSTVREIEAIGAPLSTDTLLKMSRVLVSGTRCLVKSFQLLDTDFEEATVQARQARKCDTRMEKIYRKAMNDLFLQDDVKLVVRNMEVYRTMLNSSQKIEIVGEKLVHVIVKIR